MIDRSTPTDEAIAMHRAAMLGGDLTGIADFADLLAGQHRLDEALMEIRTALGPQARSYWPLGEVLERHGRFDEALDVYRTAVAAGQTHIRSRLARLLLDRGRADEAILEIRTAIADGDLPAYGALGYALAKADRQAEAHAESDRLAVAGNWLALAKLVAGFRRADDASGTAAAS